MKEREKGPVGVTESRSSEGKNPHRVDEILLYKNNTIQNRNIAQRNVRIKSWLLTIRPFSPHLVLSEQRTKFRKNNKNKMVDIIPKP